LVRRVGGLADTVVDATPEHLASGQATGFVFDAATPAAFERSVRAALALRRDAATWQRMKATAMAQRFSWAGPARDYLNLYATVRATRGQPSSP
jgi:starch synthase